MNTIEGIPASPGITICQAFVHINDAPIIPYYSITREAVAAEYDRFMEAVAKATVEIEFLYSRQDKDCPAEANFLLNSHRLMLQDPDFLTRVKVTLAESLVNVESVLNQTMTDLINKLSQSNDQYLRERTSDLRDIAKRVLTHLVYQTNSALDCVIRPAVLICKDLMPSEMIGVDKTRIKGLAMEVGGKTSHTAILARAFEIPAVLGLADIAELVKSGDQVIVDGYRGRLILKPDEPTLHHYTTMAKALKARGQRLNGLGHLPAQTLDGKQIMLEANVEIPSEVPAVKNHGADGIGLFRSEFLFLRAKSIPGEEDQYRDYAKVLAAMSGKPVTIRTLDIGGDKLLRDMNLQTINEKNPIMGWRAIRFCLAHLEIFRSQLRAILRASAHGRLRIMFPLISGCGELDQALAFLDEVKTQLRKDGLPFDETIPVGIMIEVPSAALVSDILAKKVDFFSIGTNDLIQYTIAVDRGNKHTAYLYDPLHLGLLRLIKQIIDNGHSQNLPVTMCGEMAGDPLYTFLLIGLGLDGFSMSSSSLLEVKRIIRDSSFSDAQAFAQQALACTKPGEIQDLVRHTMENRFELTY